jgi:hypothetical protein
MRIAIRIVLGSLLGLAAPAVFAQTVFEFDLDGAQAVPPTGSEARGTAVGILNAGETSFDLEITHDVADPTAAHIHLGAPGAGGPIVFDLGSPASPIVVTWNPSPGEVADLLDGDLYVNIHSTVEPGGEIRGQIVPDCRPGTVNLAQGAVADVLFLNGSTGGVDRTVEVDTAEQAFLWGSMLLPPAGSNGKYVVHANLGAPTGATIRVLPADVGTSCFPFLVTEGAAPVIIANKLGKEHLVGSSEFFGSPKSDPPRAPAVFLQVVFPEAELPPGTTITFQGVTVDLGSVSNKSVSSTNAVTVELF